MTKNLLSPEEFRAAARLTSVDGTVDSTVFRLATGAAAVVEGATRTLRFCFSDGSIDRAGDRIDPEGWDLESFLPNPVALWAHDSYSPPIGRASNVGAASGRLMGDIEFAPPETYAFADTVYRLTKGGYVNAVSVGFKPVEWSFTNEKDRPFGIDFKRQELLEISLCPVPCNANALVEARAKGIDTRPLLEWAEKVLDGDGGRVLLSRQTLEEIFKATNTPHSARVRYRSLAEAPAAVESEAVLADPDETTAAAAETTAAAETAAAEKAAGESSNAGGGSVVGNCGRKKDEGCGLKSAQECMVHRDVSVSCGRGKDEECGMVDPAECATHAAADKALDLDLPLQGDKANPLQHDKAGRRVSARNRAKLEEALGHHEAATKAYDAMKSCIKDVLDSDEPDQDPDPDDKPEAETLDDSLSPEERRLKEARAIKQSFKSKS